MSIELTGGGGGTGTVTIAVVLPRKNPSTVVAVITAEPPPIAVIKPACVTVATAVLLEPHVTVFGAVRLTVPEDLFAVPVICCVAAVSRVTDDGVTVTPVTGFATSAE